MQGNASACPSVPPAASLPHCAACTAQPWQAPVLPVYLALADGFIISFRQLLHAFIACLTWTIRNNPHDCLCGCSRVEAKTVQHIAASLRKGRLKPKYLVITLGVKVA